MRSLHLFGAAVLSTDYRGPAYWAAVARASGVKPTVAPVILEPTPVQLASGLRVLDWDGQLPKTAAELIALAGRSGWTARATRSRFLDTPAVSGKYKGQYAEKVCCAVRLEHEWRLLVGAAFWIFDVTAGSWKADDAVLADAISWTPRQVRGIRKMNVTTMSLVVGESERK